MPEKGIRARVRARRLLDLPSLHSCLSIQRAEIPIQFPFFKMQLPTSIAALGLLLSLTRALPQGHEQWSPSAKWNQWTSPTATWDPWCSATDEPHFTPSPVVILPSGAVIGTTTSLPSATVTVNKFLGIPFAQSPPERFSPPEAPAPWWPKPINATAFKPSCIQQFVCKSC